MSFTPGPWEYKKVWQSPSYEVFREMCHIANVYGAGKKDKGNARLIAAAPEMKDLLWDAWQDLNALSQGDQTCDACYEATKTMEKIMSLLRRIEGEDA